MSALAVIGFDPLRDKSYSATRLGRDVADFLAWHELGGSSPRTLDQYERDLSRGALMFPAKGMVDIEDGDALHIARSFKPAERRVRVAAWKSFYKWGKRTRRVTIDPFDVVPILKRTPQKVYDVFSDSEIAQLVGGKDGTLLAILIDEGLRRSEACGFRLKHFRPDPSDAMPWGAVVVKGKGSKERLVRATERVASGIAQMHVLDGLRDNDVLWYGHRANAVKRSVHRPKDGIGEGTFARWWRDRIDEAGVRYRNPHMTRHTFATRWLRAGGRLERLSMAMGHASIKTTFDLYGHLDFGDVAADLALVEARG